MKYLAALVFGVLLNANAQAETIKACADDRPWLPHTTPDKKSPGTMQVLVEKAISENKHSFESVILPWKRCQEEVKKGQVHAMIGAGFVPFNREFADFPMAGSDADVKRSLGAARVVLVRQAGKTADFDGKKFINVTQQIGVPSGTKVILDKVVELGAKADDGGKTDEQNISKLLLGRLDLVAAYDTDVDALMKGKYAGKIELVKQALIETHYYLAFSKAYAEKNKATVDAIWKSIEAHNSSAKK